MLDLADAVEGSVNTFGVPLGLITLVRAYCGLRFGEVVALRQTDIKDRTITVRASVTRVAGRGYVEGPTKNHRTRWVPVPGFIWDQEDGLSLYAGTDPDELAFPGRDGGYLTPFEYRRAFDHGAKEIGMPGLIPHELRHTCASLAISAGANVLAVQRLLGHETAAMTLGLYSHLFSDDLTKVAEALDRAAIAVEALG